MSARASVHRRYAVSPNVCRPACRAWVSTVPAPQSGSSTSRRDGRRCDRVGGDDGRNPVDVGFGAGHAAGVAQLCERGTLTSRPDGHQRRWTVSRPGRVWSLVVASDGSWLASGANSVRIWDVAPGRQIRELPVETGSDKGAKGSLDAAGRQPARHRIPRRAGAGMGCGHRQANQRASRCRRNGCGGDAGRHLARHRPP